MRSGIPLIAAFIACVAPTQAATLIDLQDETGLVQHILIEGDWARINYDTTPEYMLVDLQSRKIYSIIPSRRQIIDISPPPPPGLSGGIAGKEFKIGLDKHGEGPLIAGFSTEHYQLRANGELCSDHYISAATLSFPDLVRFFSATLAVSQNQSLPGMGSDDDPCIMAVNVAETGYFKTGFPLRVVERDGIVSEEIHRIAKAPSPSTGTFAFPENYERITAEEMVRRGLEEATQSKPHAPDAQP